MSKDRSLLIIVPARNEELSVGSVVKEIARVLPDADVLVVNDGSTDRTSAVAHAAGAIVVDLPVNLGVGGAMRAGYKYAFRHGYARAVQHDADGQHDPEAIVHNYPAEYLGDTVESIVIGARAGLKIRQVGVSMRERIAGQPSHSPIRAGVFLLRAVLAFAVALSRPRTVRVSEAPP